MQQEMDFVTQFDHVRQQGFHSDRYARSPGAGVVLVEYVANLKALTASEVELIVMPLKLKGCDGSPARCVAIER